MLSAISLGLLLLVASTPPSAGKSDVEIELSDVERVIAIGDLHGDLDAARRALRLAGVIDTKDRWTGGKTVVVQLGDQVDRASDDRAILDLFDRLIDDARRAGGRVIPLVGNHEIMLTEGNLAYMHPRALRRFDDVGGPRRAFAPGGVYARKLARRALAARVDDSLFVHGGLRPEHAPQLIRMTLELRGWLRGKRSRPTIFEEAPSRRPLWMRAYSDAPDEASCALVDKTLRAFGAKRIVVAHTVQQGGITSHCRGSVWAIDVGMSRAYGGTGPVEVLELAKDQAVRVLRER